MEKKSLRLTDISYDFDLAERRKISLPERIRKELPSIDGLLISVRSEPEASRFIRQLEELFIKHDKECQMYADLASGHEKEQVSNRRVIMELIMHIRSLQEVIRRVDEDTKARDPLNRLHIVVHAIAEHKKIFDTENTLLRDKDTLMKALRELTVNSCSALGLPSYIIEGELMTLRELIETAEEKKSE